MATDSSSVRNTIVHDIDPSSSCEVKLEGEFEDHYYRVSKSALRLASPVLAKLTDPSSPWAKNNGDSTLLLYDEDPDALDILFKLIHFQKKDIPQELGLKTLYSLAVACDKYDCAQAAEPLIQDLSEQLKEAGTQAFWSDFYRYTNKKVPKGETEKIETDPEKDRKMETASMILYVSYIFNLEKIFPKAYRTNLFIWTPKRPSDDDEDEMNGISCLPDRLYKHFENQREEKRTIMLKPVLDFLKDRTFGLVYGEQGKCLRQPDCTLCDIALYGSFIRRLNYAGVYPVEEKSQSLSLFELGNRLRSIRIGKYWDPAIPNQYPHQQCTNELIKAISKGFDEAMKGEEVKLKDFKQMLEGKTMIWE